MRHRQGVIVAMALSMVLTACISDGEPEPPGETSASGTEGEPEQPVETLSPEEATEYFAQYQPTAGNTCYYRPFFVWLANGAQAETVALLAELGVTARQGIHDPEEVPGTGLDEIGAPPPFDAVLDIITLAPGSPDPLQIAEWARSPQGPGGGVAASAVHAIGMAGHWQFKPGSDPESANAPASYMERSSNTGDEYIAVVDTGFVPGQDPGWLTSSVIDDGFGDNHPFSASHGTFISSVVVQMTGYPVSFASIPAISLQEFLVFDADPDDDGVVGVGAVGDELGALAGIERIIGRHKTDTSSEQHGTEVMALNLSWGTYPCDLGGAFEDALALFNAMGVWVAEFPDSAVFAAAGNEDDRHGPFYPAALDAVVGVAAEGINHGVVIWDDTGPVEDTTARSWATITAPGCDVIGMSGGSSLGAVVTWSGSSFASAAATASWVEADIPKDEAMLGGYLSDPPHGGQNPNGC